VFKIVIVLVNEPFCTRVLVIQGAMTVQFLFVQYTIRLANNEREVFYWLWYVMWVV